MFCQFCGTKLTYKKLNDEGMTPYCEYCGEYRFPLYPVAVSMIIVNKDETKTLFVKQYGRDFFRFVAGYINKGEDAEDAVRREMKEEIGIEPIKVKPLMTRYYENSETLMINFLAVVDDMNIKPNIEIDSYKWFDIEEAKKETNIGNLVKEFFDNYLNNK